MNSRVVDLEDAETDETWEGWGEESVAEEDRNSETKFCAVVEERHVEDSPGEEASFEGSDLLI